MARNRASMREGPLADLFRATEAAQRQSKTEQGEQQQLPTEPPVTPAPVLEEPEPVEPPELFQLWLELEVPVSAGQR